MDIKIEDYLTHEEIKEICVAEIRSAIEKDAERILSNNAYKFVTSYVGELLNKRQDDLLRQKVKEIFGNLSAHTVIGAPTHWDKTEGRGYKVMNDAIDQHKSIIYDRVKEVFENEISAHDLKDAIQDAIADALQDVFNGAK